jgi:outer membrane protein
LQSSKSSSPQNAGCSKPGNRIRQRGSIALLSGLVLAWVYGSTVASDGPVQQICRRLPAVVAGQSLPVRLPPTSIQAVNDDGEPLAVKTAQRLPTPRLSKGQSVDKAPIRLAPVKLTPTAPVAKSALRIAPVQPAENAQGPKFPQRLAPVKLARRLPSTDSAVEQPDQELPSPALAVADQRVGDSEDLAVAEVPEIVLGIEERQLRYPETETLELHQAIHLALMNAPEIVVLRSDVGIALAEVERQDAAFDWTMFVSSTWDDRNNPVASQLDGVQDRLLNRDLNNQAGVRQQNQYGGSVSVGQLGNFADSNSQFFIPGNQAIAQLGVTYEQPLLRGGGRQVARSRFDLAVSESLVSQESFFEGLQTQLIATINAYWDLASSRATCAIQRRNFARAEDLVQLVKKRAEVDVGPAQLARAEATLAARKTELLRSEYAVVLAQEQLMRLMLGPAFNSHSTKEVVPTSDLLAKSAVADLEMQQQIALQNRPEIRRSIEQIKQAAIEQGVAKNQLLPALGLSLSMSNRGLAGDRQFGRALEDQFNLTNSTYGVGLAYEMPIGNRAARANLSQAKLRIARLQSQLEATIADVTLQVRNASHLLALSIQELELSTQENLLAQRELHVIENRYLLLIDGDAVGLIYLDNLLLTQERLAAAELRLVEAALRCKRAEFELQRATGQLLRQSQQTL